MSRSLAARSKLARYGHQRALELRRQLADEIRRYREDAGLSQHRLAEAAGVSQSLVSDLEAARKDPGVEALARVGSALGGRLVVRIDPGTGSPIRDHLQSAIAECLHQTAASRWKRLTEVPVYRPVRGVIDSVLHDPDADVILATEIQSELRRLEQQIRWIAAKADALATGGVSSQIASALGLDSQRPARVERLLIVRSSVTTRHVVATYRALIANACPAG